MEKIVHILKEISRKKGETELYQILQRSEFVLDDLGYSSNLQNAYNLEILTDPNLFTELYDSIQQFRSTIKERINKSTPIIINRLTLTPDYDRIHLLNSHIELVRTPWEEINNHQEVLTQTLIQAQQSLDFQKVGLICRTILEKLADIVFDPSTHISETLDLQKGKFKNQLQAFIEFKLSGKSNEELRKLAKSSIGFSRDSIEVIQKTTHKLDGQRYVAEICAISAISTISLIKTINEIE